MSSTALVSTMSGALSPTMLAIVAASPWLASPALFVLRMRATPALGDVDADVRLIGSTPRVSVILPARDEAAHITECVRSILGSTWPELELIVVDDHSTDGTAALAREAAGGDARVRVIEAPPLPTDWFGKQWACHTGVAHATGSLLLFTDADTRHAPDLIARMVQTRAARGAELLSVAGRQEMMTLWERAVQPLMFGMIMARFGSASAMERARRASDVAANGQCFMLSRTAYDSVGGHEAVRDFVAEDVMIAQAAWLHGHRVSVARGREQLSTRMYDGLAALVRGWTKNVYAGGRHAVRGGRVGRALFPLALLLFPLLLLFPIATLPVAIGVSEAGVALQDDPWVLWSALSTGGLLFAAAIVNRVNGDPMRRALLLPLGAGLLLGIFAIALARGRNVEWKRRGYTAR